MNTHFDRHRELILRIVDKIIQSPSEVRDEATRKMMFKIAQRCIKEETDIEDAAKKSVNCCQPDPVDIHLAILHTVERTLSEYHLSDNTIQRLFGSLIKRRFLRETPAKIEHPSCLIIHPYQHDLHLELPGVDRGNLDPQDETWAFYERVIDEACRLWGIDAILCDIRQIAEDNSLFEFAQKFADCCFFIVLDGVSNTQSFLDKLESPGNLIPLLTLHGSRLYTDSHFGAGQFDRTMADMDLLFRAGIPYGVLLPANSENIDDLLEGSFVHEIFQTKHALFASVLQYLPFRAHPLPQLLPTAAQRLNLWNNICRLISNEHFLLMDACAENLSCGCPAAGGSHQNGWFDIHQNGNVYPCHEFPYVAANLIQIYQQGGNLDDIRQQPFFSGIRRRRGTGGEPQAPLCLLRDDLAAMQQLVQAHHPIPADEHTDDVFHDPSLSRFIGNSSAEFRSLLEQSKS